MNLILSGRGVELDDSLREYATEKLTRVQRLFDRIIKMEVHFDHERNPRVKDPDRVEVTVKMATQTLRVHGEGLDHHAAIDMASDRLEAQLRKVKGRLEGRIHRPRGSEADAAQNGFAGSDDGEAPDYEVRPQQLAKPVTPDEARMEIDTRKLSFMLFTNAETMRATVIYRLDHGGYGLIEHDS
jgi:putative sigma-54 modulation protein